MPISVTYPLAVRDRYPEGPEAYHLANAQRIAAIVSGPSAHVTVQSDGPRFILGDANNWIMDVDEENNRYIVDWRNSLGRPRLKRHYKRVIIHQLGLEEVNRNLTPKNPLANAHAG